MLKPEFNLQALTETMKAAGVRWQHAKQTGDEAAIKIAEGELRKAVAAVDRALDRFEDNVLGGRFRRKRDLLGSTVVPFNKGRLQ
jgi:hypothetical protein